MSTPRLLFFFFFLPLISKAQSISVDFDHIVDEQEIPLGFTQNLIYDSTGIAWIAGWHDVIKYDGYKVTRFRSLIGKDTLTIDGRTEMIHSGDGRFWIMDHQRVYLFDPYLLRLDSVIHTGDLFKPYNVQNTSLRATSDGDLMVLSSFNSIDVNTFYAYIIHIRKGKAKIIDGIEGINGRGPFLEIYKDTSYVTSQENIYRFDENGQKLASFPLPKNELFYPKLDIDKEGVFWLKSNTIVYKSDQNIFQVNRQSGDLTKVHIPASLDLSNTRQLLHQDGNLWLGGINGELIKYNIENKSWVRYGEEIKGLENFPFVGSETSELIYDERGIVWLCNTHGLIRVLIDELPVKSYLTKPKSSYLYDYCSVRGIAEDKDENLYISYYTNISKEDKKTGLINEILPHKINSLPAAYSLSIAGDSLFYLDLAMDLKTNKFQELIKNKSNGHITNCLDGNGNLWLFSWMPLQLFKYNLLNKTLLQVPLPNRVSGVDFEVNQMKWDENLNGLWLGTTGAGLILLSEYGSLLRSFTVGGNDGELGSNNAKSMHLDSDSLIWVGHSFGLSKIPLGGGEIEQFHVRGSESIEVVGILPEGDRFLWVSTNLGVYRFDKKLKIFSGFPKTTILANSEFNRQAFFKTKDGRMVFGSLNGAFSFRPEEVTPYLSRGEKNRVILTSYTRYNIQEDQPIVSESGLANLNQIELRHHDRYFQLEYCIPDYSSHRDVLYQHKLEDYDKDWSQKTTFNRLRYDNLKPGKYTLRIRGGVDEQSFDSSIHSIEIIVHKAWYNTFLFYFICAALAYLIAYSIFKARLKQRLRIEGIRTKISSDLHDDVGTVLSGIAMQSEIMASKTSGENKPKLDRIADLSRESMMKMRDIVWALDSRKDTVENLIAKINEFAQESLLQKGVTLKWKSKIQDTKLISPEVRRAIYLICKEAFVNVLKHSNASTVTCALKKSKGNVIFHLKDNGSKPPEEGFQTGQGIENMGMRAKRANGVFSSHFKNGFEINVEFIRR